MIDPWALVSSLVSMGDRPENAPPQPPSVCESPPPPYEMSSPTAMGQAVPDEAPLSARARKRQLQEELERANATTRGKDTAGLFKEVCSTDLLFLIDATNSMKPHLDAAIAQVRRIVAEVKEAFFNQSQLRVAVVAYRDHNASPNVEFLDFTSSTDQAHAFLSNLEPRWGRDAPEDVLGGLQQAVNASWKHRSRCLVHIADAPAHGSDLHDFSESADDYFKSGSEPHGLTYKPLLEKLIRLNVNYALLRITKNTDRMALAFSGVYGYSNARLHECNKYCGQMAASKSLKFGSGTVSRKTSTTACDPQFEEQQLGTTYTALKQLVVKSVTSSVTLSASRLTRSPTERSTIKNMRPSSNLNEISEDAEDPVAKLFDGVLEDTQPEWTTPGWLDLRLEVGGFCPVAILHDADTLNDMIDHDESIKLSVSELTVFMRSKPFAKGGERLAAYARTEGSSTDRYVVKWFLDAARARAEVVEGMRIQALCKAFALEFNGLLSVEPPLDFLVTSCLEAKRTHVPLRDKRCLSLERYIEGEYVKYNSNKMYVNQDLADNTFNQFAQAFSHFTFERSWGHLLVNDLQGVGHLLTDPAIQTKDPRRFQLSGTNYNEEGFKFFFATHECNDYCAQLQLKSNGKSLISRNPEFRETWPTMKPTVCCSNMLCRSIIRRDSANESRKYPNHYWCDSCWPQLQESMDRWICAEPGPTHHFEVNRFYHQSRGQRPPRKCSDHTEKDTAGSSAAAAGASFWKNLRIRASTNTLSGRQW